MPGIPVLGVVRADDATVTTRDGIPLLLWDWKVQPFALVVGGTGAGKTGCLRPMIRHILDLPTVKDVVLIDGKAEGDLVAFAGRPKVRYVAHTPDEWLEALRWVQQEANRRHAAVLAWRSGYGPKPDLSWISVFIDEIQAVIAAHPDVKEIITDLAKTSRSAGVRIVLATQRPDVTDTLPGSVRDQLDVRIVVGTMSPKGAQMAFEGDWRAVADDPDHPRPVILGRMTVKVGGRIVRAQAPWLPDPVEDPAAEVLYPPRPDGWRVPQAPQASAPALRVVEPQEPAQKPAQEPQQSTATGTDAWGSRRRRHKGTT